MKKILSFLLLLANTVVPNTLENTENQADSTVVQNDEKKLVILSAEEIEAFLATLSPEEKTHFERFYLLVNQSMTQLQNSSEFSELNTFLSQKGLTILCQMYTFFFKEATQETLELDSTDDIVSVE